MGGSPDDDTPTVVRDKGPERKQRFLRYLSAQTAQIMSFFYPTCDDAPVQFLVRTTDIDRIRWPPKAASGIIDDINIIYCASGSSMSLKNKFITAMAATTRA